MNLRGHLGATLIGVVLTGAACLDLAPPTAQVYVYNSEPAAIEIRVTDNAECSLGLTADLGQNTRTTYDVDAGSGGFVCLGPGSKKAFPVKPGGKYMVKGTTLVDDPNPGEAGGEGGILDALEQAGRESQGQ